MSRILYALVVVAVLCSCGDGTSEAIKRGIGSECNTTDALCSEASQSCLTEFKGGYCGKAMCMHDTDCPAGSDGVTADDQINYCFLICLDKPDCNVRRSLENESNCTSSLAFVDGTNGRKVCNPPSSGI